MKRLLYTLILAAALLTAGLHAQAEKNVLPIYSTDIQTTLDGLPIEGYNIGGQTLIILDDLEDYGFSIFYDDGIRALIVNKTHSPSADFQPQTKRDATGKVIGYTGESDIKAYVNGNYVDSYVVNGKLAAVAEVLGERAKISGFVGESSLYNMECVYKDSQRTLSISTTPSDELSYDEKTASLYSYIDRQQPTFGIGDVEKDVIPGCDAVIVNQYDYWDDSKTITRLLMMYHDGHVIDMSDILDSAYGFGAFPYLTVFDGKLSEDKTQFLFYGERYQPTGLRSSELIESGNYSMDIVSGNVIKLD